MRGCEAYGPTIRGSDAVMIEVSLNCNGAWSVDDDVTASARNSFRICQLIKVLRSTERDGSVFPEP